MRSIPAAPSCLWKTSLRRMTNGSEDYVFGTQTQLVRTTSCSPETLPLTHDERQQHNVTGIQSRLVRCTSRSSETLPQARDERQRRLRIRDSELACAMRKTLFRNPPSTPDERSEDGGEGGIRTLGPLARSTVFETAPFDHSGTSPFSYLDLHKTEPSTPSERQRGLRIRESESICALHKPLIKISPSTLSER